MSQTMLDSIVRIAGIATESVVDGPGLRSTIFFQGCPHACEGCHNPETWDPEGGQSIVLSDLVAKLKLNPLITGITLSGGEPFLQAVAAAEVGDFLKKQGCDLWVYTGYTWEYLLANLNNAGFSDLLKLTDVLVDGPFQSQYKNLKLPFRGSSNQRLIKVAESMKCGVIVQWQPTVISIKP
jgi:anaerobic ribonucleoside-triphosphate reductase activating protein